MEWYQRQSGSGNKFLTSTVRNVLSPRVSPVASLDLTCAAVRGRSLPPHHRWPCWATRLPGSPLLPPRLCKVAAHVKQVHGPRLEKPNLGPGGREARGDSPRTEAPGRLDPPLPLAGGSACPGRSRASGRPVSLVALPPAFSEAPGRQSEGRRGSLRAPGPSARPVLPVSFPGPRVTHHSSCHIELQMLLPQRMLRLRPFFFILTNNLVMKY